MAARRNSAFRKGLLARGDCSVQFARDHFLAAAGLALNQDGGFRPADLMPPANRSRSCWGCYPEKPLGGADGVPGRQAR